MKKRNYLAKGVLRLIERISGQIIFCISQAYRHKYCQNLKNIGRFLTEKTLRNMNLLKMIQVRLEKSLTTMEEQKHWYGIGANIRFQRWLELMLP